MTVGRRVLRLNRVRQRLRVRIARPAERIDRPQDGLDGAEHVALGMGERIQAEPPQRCAQRRGIRLAQFEIMYEIASALPEFGMHPGQVFRILCFERHSAITNVLEQSPDLADVGVFVHANLIIRGEHKWHKY